MHHKKLILKKYTPIIYCIFISVVFTMLISSPYTMAEHVNNTAKTKIQTSEIEKLANIRNSQLVTLRGDNIPDLLGYPITHLALFSCQPGEWVQVPMQVDQASMLESIHYIKGSEVDIDGDAQLLDKKDEVVFLAKHAGKKWHNTVPPKGVTRLVQIEIEDTFASKNGYVYIAAFDTPVPELNTPSAVQYDKAHLRFYGKRYNIELDPKNQLIIKKIIFNSLAGERNLIDYIKGETTITMALGLKIKRGLENVQGELIAVKTGPVRCISHLKVTVHYGPFTIAKVFTEVAYSDLGVVIPIQTAIPTKRNWLIFGASKVIKKIQTNVGLDFNCDPEGKYEILSALNQPFVIDGKKQAEEDANGVRVNIKEPWILIAKPRGSGVFGYLDLNILKNIRENAGKLGEEGRKLLAEAEDNIDEITITEFSPQQINNRQIPGIANTNLGEVMQVSDQSLELIYIDDAEANDPEGRYPGHLPYVGFNYQLSNMNETLKALNKVLKDPEKEIPDNISIVNTLYIYLLSESITDGKYLYDMFQNPPKITSVQNLSEVL